MIRLPYAYRLSLLWGYVYCFLASLPEALADPIVISPTQNLPDINYTEPGQSIASIISYGIGLAGILGIIGVTWGGIIIISGAGDEEKMKQGRKIIMYSLMGVFVAGIAYLAVNFLANLQLTS